jgi:hypothetical protein
VLAMRMFLILVVLLGLLSGLLLPLLLLLLGGSLLLGKHTGSSASCSRQTLEYSQMRCTPSGMHDEDLHRTYRTCQVGVLSW